MPWLLYPTQPNIAQLTLGVRPLALSDEIFLQGHIADFVRTAHKIRNVT